MGPFDFHYSLSRPYPYTWFKWVVYIGGICLLVIFSILNLASTGYNLDVRFSIDPNATASEKLWTQKLPLSLNEKVVPSCNAQNLQTNQQYFTNKFGLVYTVANVWQKNESGQNITLPSVQYLNNPLEHCIVQYVQLDLSSDDDRTAAQMGWTPWGMVATAYVNCLVVNNAHTWINLTTTYEFVLRNIETGAGFQFVRAPRKDNETALWWGESLMSWYWMDVVYAMHENALYEYADAYWSIPKGSIILQPSNKVTDITDLDYFKHPNYHFVQQNYNNASEVSGPPTCCISPYDRPPSISGLEATSTPPKIWIESDSFAKIFLSTILVDLGQSTAINALNDPTALSFFSKKITRMAGKIETTWLQAGPARAPYERHQQANLTISPSVFYNQYVCQVPALKSTGTLIFAILVADLVFLQAAWKILTFVTTSVLQWQDSTASYCAGCLGAADGRPRLTAPKSGSYQSVASVDPI